MDNLTQAEADALLGLEKHYRGSKRFEFPDSGKRLHIPLHSHDGREEFMMDITSSRVRLRKNTFQNRARKTVILARVDIGGAPHRNPDGEEMPCPHLHIYKEGFGDKWAIPLPSDKFSEHDNPLQVLDDFMRFCNVATRPSIRGVLLA